MGTFLLKLDGMTQPQGIDQVKLDTVQLLIEVNQVPFAGAGVVCKDTVAVRVGTGIDVKLQRPVRCHQAHFGLLLRGILPVAADGKQRQETDKNIQYILHLNDVIDGHFKITMR